MGWYGVGAPLMPDEALMLFPPVFAARSRRITGIRLASSCDAAERPARPEPTTMAYCNNVSVV